VYIGRTQGQRSGSVQRIDAAGQIVFRAQVAQELPALPGGSNQDQIVRAVEAEGASFSRLPAAVRAPPTFAAIQKGTPERKCVIGSEKGPVRSGEFVIGGQLGVPLPLTHGKAGKIWWSPLMNAPDMPALIVRGRSVSSIESTMRFTTSSVAYPTTRGEPLPPVALRDYFFPSGFEVPSAGRWIFVATSGANWGCFILDVM